MPRRLLINEQPSFASIGYSHQQLSRVPRGMANRHSQFHCPKSKISKVWIVLGKNKQWGRAADIQRGWVVIASKCVFDLIFLDQFTRPVFICFDPI